MSRPDESLAACRVPIEPGDDTPGFIEYWRMVAAHKFVMLTFLCVGAVLALGVAMVRMPLYEGHAMLELLEINVDFLNLRAVDSTVSSSSFAPEIYVATQAKVIQSRALTEAVVDQLKMADLPQFHDDSRLTRYLNLVGIYPASLPWFRKLSPRELAIEAASDALHVKTMPGDRIIELTFDWGNPKLAADFANTLTAVFITRNVEARWKASQTTGDWLAEQLRTTRAKLASLESELQAYAHNSGWLFTSEKENVTEEKLRQIQAELSRAQADRALRESSFEMSCGTPDILPEVQDSPKLKEYATRLADMRREMAELGLVLTPAHYRVARLKAQIEEQERAMDRERSNIVARIQNEFDRASAREKLLASAYEAQAKIVGDQAAKRAHYNVLEREVETNRRIYDGMLERVRDARVAAAIRASNVRVVSPATPQTRPSKPKLWLYGLGGCFSGVLLGFGFIVARERANHTFRAPEEVSRVLGTSGLGAIPSAGDLVRSHTEPRFRAGRLLRIGSFRTIGNGNGNVKPRALELITWQERPSMLAESFRRVLASMMFSVNRSAQPKVLVFTSPTPREGKTTVITNIAIALTELGLRVAVIDGDLREPRLQDVFGLPNMWGLSSLITGGMSLGECPLEALIHSTEIPSLHVITSGPGTATVSGALASKRLRELVERLRKEFDAVLIDTPPMLQFADARIIARVADGVVLVVRANSTDRAEALSAAQRLFEDGTRLIGAVLNDCDLKAGSYKRYKLDGFPYPDF